MSLFTLVEWLPKRLIFMSYPTVRSFAIALIAVGLFGLTACDQTIDKTPEQSVPPDQVFQDVAGAEAALNATYDGMQGDVSCGTTGCIHTVGADIGADTGVFTGSFTTFEDVEAFNMDVSNPVAENIWADHYQIINRANLVIENTPEVPNIDQATVDDFVGQAKFLRALSYFNLVRWFARPYNPDGENDQPGVPLTTEAVESTAPNFNKPRSPVDSIYIQIRNDLTDAIDRLGVKTNAKRAGSAAANGLLARVSLYQGRYEEASQRAQSVIDRSDYTLASNPITPFLNEQNSELLLSVSFSATDNPGVNDFITAFYLAGPLGGRGDVNPSPDLLSTADSNDIRFQVGGFEGETGLYQNSGSLWTNKWTDNNNGDDVPLLRLAEMHLIRAEAQARGAMENGSGSFSEARSHVNMIRNRAGLTDVSSSLSGQALIDEILKQRRLEFAFEGKRRHTLQRLGLPITNGEGLTIEAGDTQRLFPIPERTINVNDAISEEDQNPGY
jgi:hypothetical protein